MHILNGTKLLPVGSALALALFIMIVSTVPARAFLFPTQDQCATVNSVAVTCSMCDPSPTDASLLISVSMEEIRNEGQSSMRCVSFNKVLNKCSYIFKKLGSEDEAYYVKAEWHYNIDGKKWTNRTNRCR